MCSDKTEKPHPHTELYCHLNRISYCWIELPHYTHSEPSLDWFKWQRRRRKVEMDRRNSSDSKVSLHSCSIFSAHVEMTSLTDLRYHWIIIIKIILKIELWHFCMAYYHLNILLNTSRNWTSNKNRHYFWHFPDLKGVFLPGFCACIHFSNLIHFFSQQY